MTDLRFHCPSCSSPIGFYNATKNYIARSPFDIYLPPLRTELGDFPATIFGCPLFLDEDALLLLKFQIVCIEFAPKYYHFHIMDLFRELQRRDEMPE